ncbi:hypothetical protein J4E83_003893 [Alternaria metachromatica]|uniref:uncharacterized protein n=1 Tax=Alternaria metachromatica TaxID=283354 RepID=UPI0020C42AEB|nr:uncharacterized protein J4E83_003893 [Alternaria metachromatica]KAI4626741.1 hypothetical protein J4E83_003893 [Alternaria metachromatica]
MPYLDMAFVHPDRAKNVGDARAQAGRATSVRGRAGDLAPAQGRNRRRKWEDTQDEQYPMAGGEIQAPDEYDKTSGNRPGNRRPEHAQGPGKKAKFEHTRPPRPNAFDADRNRRPEVEASVSPKRSDPPRPNKEKPGRRNADREKLDKARQLAPKYPDIRDIDAWRKRAQTNERIWQAEDAFVYRHLRFDQCPKGLAFKEWKIRVHREMEGLGLEHPFTGRHTKREPEDEINKETVAGETEAAVATAQKEEESKRRVEMERMAADDGFDIDIYGDEETRRKYEPWIRSRMDRV